VGWPAAQKALIMKVELQATRARNPDICASLVAIKHATKATKEYPRVHDCKLADVDNQPYLEAVMLGGANPGRGMVLVDSGACFTMVTELFVERHGYRMCPYNATFTQASAGGPMGDVIGVIDMQLQLHPMLVLQLKDVKVQPGMSDYSCILGCDITNPNG
jgi:hypothetical protein